MAEQDFLNWAARKAAFDDAVRVATPNTLAVKPRSQAKQAKAWRGARSARLPKDTPTIAKGREGPSAENYVRAVAGIGKRAIPGTADALWNAGSYLLNTGPGEMIGDAKTLGSNIWDIAKKDPVRFGLGVTPIVGDTMGVLDTIHSAAAARHAGDLETAHDIESMAFPSFAVGLLPEIGSLGAGAMRAGMRLARRGAGEAAAEAVRPAYRAAAETYPNHVDEHTAFGTSERVPYVGSGHLSGIVGGDDAARAAYSNDPRASWRDEGGRDIILGALGAHQRPMLDATGVYKPPGGKLEINPATVTRPVVGMEDGVVDPASRDLMNISEALRGYVDVQGASAWHKPIADAPPDQMGSIFAPHEGPLGADTILKLRSMGERYGLPDVIDTGQGATITNFEGAPSGTETDKALGLGLDREIKALTGGAAPHGVKVDSGYGQHFELGGAPGSGVVTKALEDLVSHYPGEVIDKLDASQALRGRYLSGMDLDTEMAGRGYGEAREDVQRARRILGEGGLRGLFDARRSGVALPSIAALAAMYGLSDLYPPQGEQAYGGS